LERSADRRHLSQASASRRPRKWQVIEGNSTAGLADAGHSRLHRNLRFSSARGSWLATAWFCASPAGHRRARPTTTTASYRRTAWSTTTGTTRFYLLEELPDALHESRRDDLLQHVRDLQLPPLLQPRLARRLRQRVNRADPGECRRL